MMHQSSLLLMKKLLEEYAPVGEYKDCYDIGSFNVNGTYRIMVEALGYLYRGVDITPGPNVDVVVSEDMEKPWGIPPADLVISGQCLEHVKNPFHWMRNAGLAGKGKFIIIAPFIWGEHKYPVDCFRFLPDGMKALFEYANIKHIDSGIVDKDCWAVGESYD